MVEKFLSLSELNELVKIIDLIINPDVILSRGGLIRANARVSAVLPDQNPLLDVARQSYKENMEDVFALAQQYASSYITLLPSMTSEANLATTQVDLEHLSFVWLPLWFLS